MAFISLIMYSFPPFAENVAYFEYPLCINVAKYYCSNQSKLAVLYILSTILSNDQKKSKFVFVALTKYMKEPDQNWAQYLKRRFFKY